MAVGRHRQPLTTLPIMLLTRKHKFRCCCTYTRMRTQPHTHTHTWKCRCSCLQHLLAHRRTCAIFAFASVCCCSVEQVRLCCTVKLPPLLWRTTRQIVLCRFTILTCPLWACVACLCTSVVAIYSLLLSMRFFTVVVVAVVLLAVNKCAILAIYNI